MKNYIKHSHLLLVLAGTGIMNSLFAQPVSVTPIQPNWNIQAIEGVRMHLSPAKARNMNVAVCSRHFPVGSQGRKNIKRIVKVINSAPYLGIRMNITEIPHFDEPNLFTCNPTFSQDLFIEIIDDLPVMNQCGNIGSGFSATASVAHYVFDPALNQNVWTWGRTTNGLPSEKAVLCLRRSNYSRYAADPMNNPGNAPSEGVIAHELGHMLHMEHGESRLLPVMRLLEDLCNRRGGVDVIGVDHDSDPRRTRITAYTRALLGQIYPPASAFTDTKHEWVIHDVINRKNHLTDVRSQDMRYFSKMNPIELAYDSNTQLLWDERTGRVPVFNCQFSDASLLPNTRDSVRLVIKIRDRVSKEEYILVKRDIQIYRNSPMAQYDFNWLHYVRIPEGDIRKYFNSWNLDLVFRIDSNLKFDEYDEKNNRLAMPIRLRLRVMPTHQGTRTPSIDPNESSVADHEDIRYASMHNRDGIMVVDMNFYREFNVRGIRCNVDVDQDGIQDYLIMCNNEEFQVIGRNGSGNLVEVIHTFKPAINGDRYQATFPQSHLGLNRGDNFDYWFQGVSAERVPDTGHYEYRVQ